MPTGSRSTRCGTRPAFVGPLGHVRLPTGYYAAFVELHIEQGPLLGARGAIGVVTAIAAPATSLTVDWTGEGGHAGAVLMPDRRDALCAPPRSCSPSRRRRRATGSPDTVATVGVCRSHPGAVNSIPSRVELDGRRPRRGLDPATAAVKASASPRSTRCADDAA